MLKTWTPHSWTTRGCAHQLFALATLGRMADLGNGSPLWRITTDLNYRAMFNALEEVTAPK